MLKKIKNPIIATLLSFNRIDYKKDINMKSGVDRFLDRTAFLLPGIIISNSIIWVSL